MTINEKLGLLREQMANNDIQAVIIPSSDSHQSEYVADHWKSREWISGFTGSAGTAVITLDHAGVWTDSRYYLQAEEELADSEFELHKVINYTPDFDSFLRQNLESGQTVACDGRAFSNSEIENYKKFFKEKEINVRVDLDLAGSIWAERPALPKAEIFTHDVKYAGRTIDQKLGALRESMEEHKVDSYLLTSLDDIAWLFNLRGRDIEYNPVFYAFALIYKNEAILFVDQEKINSTLKDALSSSGVSLQDYEDIYDHVSAMQPNSRLYLTEGAVNHLLFTAVNAEIVNGEAIVHGMKAIKNEIEIEHFKNVMEKDAVALTRLFMWLEKELENRTVSEYELSTKLAGFRSKQKDYYGESFNTIAGYAGNGAIVHYGPKETGSADIRKEGILLLDSGGQYLDGTTDITRTVALGPVTNEQKKHFTLVLKGHIALDELVYPEGVNGYQLDAFARQHLWKHGINYFHGTGHGVGFFLNVHEGPHGISFVYSGRSNKPMQAGMITSNEPGVYIEGEYGIRIENLILSKVVEENEFGTFLGHENLTLFPIDQQLIDTSLLCKHELKWLDEYHSMVYNRVKKYLNEEERAWLKEKCKPLD